MTMAEMQEVYGEFATSLTERMKRRRRHAAPVSYREDGREEGRRRRDEDDSQSETSSNAMDSKNFNLLCFCLKCKE